MDATQIISDSILESDEEENKEEIENKRGRPLAKLCILKNEHIPETELPLFLGDNVLGRDPNTCTLPLPAPSISKQHATICISVYRRRGRHSEVETEALIWDHGSMNGTRKGHMKLTPNVRYALSEGDCLAVADISCQYVSCTIGRVSSKGDTMASVSKHSGVNDISLDGSGEKGGDTSTGGNTCFNGDTKASVLLSDQEDIGKTSVRTSYLSFEQTPTQPHGTLVPESDSDSDDKKGDGRRKALVSNSDFHESGPACSTFLSPTNKIVPESEDESPITPPSSAKNRPHRLVSFSKEDQGVQQQLKNENILGVVHNNEEEEEEEERAALVGSKSEESEHRVSGKHESNVSLTGENELPKSSATFLTDPIPVFDMDSDTDVEGEEERGASAGPVTLNANQQADHPPNTAHFYIDSDTDVDDQVHKSAPSSADHTKPLHVISVLQPEGITFDSDTDMDEDDVSEAAIVTASLRSTNAVVSSPSKQRNNLHLDSDTDIEEDEEEENQCRKNSSCSKIDETPTLLDIKSTGPKSEPDSETEDGAIPAPAICELSVVSAGTESVTTADLGGVLGFLSDSDTDVEDDSSLLMPVVASNWSINPGIMSGALQADSDADRDVDESSMSPAGDGVDPADLRVDSDTDVEDEENQVPSLRRENTPGLLVPLQQNCSTPVQVSGGELEDMETQAFLIPASSPFGHLRPMSLSPGSANPEDDLCVVAETQSFLLTTRDCQGNPSKIHSEDPIQSSVSETCKQFTRGESFQLGLSESSHLEGQAQALATESTQAFVSVVQGVNLEDTQAYADTTSLENDSNLQAHGDDQEPATCSEMSAKEGCVDFSLEATQAYISEPDSDSEVETNEDERIITAAAETPPFFTSSTIALAETQPMFNMEEEEESLSHKNPIPSVLQVKSSSQHVTKEKEEPVEAAHPVTETQPMHVSEDEEIDGEELFLQKANQLRLEDQSQTLTKSESSLAETQPIGQAETLPMASSGKEESDVSLDLIPGPRKSKAKQMWLDYVQIQTLANPELSTVETQPVDTCTDSESDEGDSTPGPRKRRAKVLQLEDETEPLTSSAVVETELLATCMSEQRKDEDTTPGPRRRKAKTLPLEEEETQPLTVSEVSAVESQPIVAGEERESDDEDSIPGPRKRTAKPIQKEDSTEGTKTVTPPPRGKGRQTEAGSSGTSTRGGRKTTRARLREEEEQAECSEPPKRRRTRAMKALTSPTSTVSRGKARLDEEESVKEEEVEQAKQARGKTFTVDPKDSKQDEETLETGRKNIENNILKKPKGREEQYQKLEMERKDKEEHDRLQAEDAEKLRLEQEGAEKERIERERKEEDEKEIADRTQKEREEHLKQKRNNEEENERHEKAAREEERIEKERAKEEKERLECEKAEREENERTEKIRKEDQEKLQCEKAEREKKEMAEMERKEEEKERLMTAKREQEERLERERNEQEKKAKEKQTKEQQGNQKEENSPKTTTTGQRTTRRTRGAPRTTGPHQDSTTSANDDVPAKRTRSRSNSSNSVSSERSVSSVSTQGSSGRGRGAKRQAAIATSSNRRTVAAEPTQRDIHDLSPRGVRSRSNSEISSCSLSSHSRGRGGRQRGRGRKTESDSIPPAGSQSGQNLAPEPTTRGRRGRKEFPPEEEKEEADSQPASTIRGRQRANANSPKPAAGDQKSPSSQRCARKDSLLPKSNVLGRGQKAVKSETVEVPPAPAVSDGEEAKEKTKGTKRDSKANAEADSSWSSKISEVKEQAQTIEEAQDKSQVQVVRKGRASSAQAKKKANVSSAELVVKEESEETEEGTVRRRVRGRPSMVQKLKKEKQEEMDQDPPVEASETPTSSVSRKRPALTDSSPAAKTTRSSSASPAAGGQWRAARQAYKVLFTGVVDEEGERVLARLGGSLAEGVADMNCLVTDKVRRTVKFLCALAKGVPIVTTHWLERSGRAGSFLPPNAFVVKDPEQEKKFSFSLQDSLGIASNQRLLQGYQIHVTKSVKPEPVHMKDIISCSGATFLPKMPSSYKPQTVVISCEEDLRLCGTALSESVPVVTAEFILTGILRQKVDLETHKLSAPANTPQPAGGRGRSRKKT